MYKMAEIGLNFASIGEKKNRKILKEYLRVGEVENANLLGMSKNMLEAGERGHPSWTSC